MHGPTSTLSIYQKQQQLGDCGIFKDHYQEAVASCGYSQTVLYLLLLFRQGCSAAPRGAEEGRRGQDQKNILWRWKDILPQLTFRHIQDVFFWF